MRRPRSYEQPGQPFPVPGSTAIQSNLGVATLRHVLGEEQSTGYSYQLNTIHPHDGGFSQHGSAPNFQGGRITLCSCKHTLRAYRDPQDWASAWIAGFTSKGREGFDRHYLLYLMQVSHAFTSQDELWKWLSEQGDAQAKAADRNVCGDFYRPKTDLTDPFDWRDYCTPAAGHVHGSGDMWHLDIADRDVVARFGRVPALFVGHEQRSFLWDRPRVYLPYDIGRTNKMEMASLLEALQET